MGAGVASRAGVSAHDLLRSGEPRVGGGRVRGEEEEEEEAEEEEEEEGTESKRGDVDISSVTLEECDGLRRGRRTMPTFFFVILQNTRKDKIFHQQCRGCPFLAFCPF